MEEAVLKKFDEKCASIKIDGCHDSCSQWTISMHCNARSSAPLPDQCKFVKLQMPSDFAIAIHSIQLSEFH